jgi:DNA-binding NtrC family response regulator
MPEALRQKPLRCRRILVVEDSGILAAGFEAILKDAGADVATALDLEAAERLAQDDTLSSALLDIWLNGDAVWSVARHLDRKCVPFVFLSGFLDRERLPQEWRGRPFLTKPARSQAIIRAVADLFESRFRSPVTSSISQSRSRSSSPCRSNDHA